MYFELSILSSEAQACCALFNGGCIRNRRRTCSSVFANLDRAGETGAAVETAPINFTALKEHIAASTIWQYEGSLTTPSCDEGVSWNVVENPLFISSTTYRQIKSVIKFNSRYTQNAPGEVNLVDNACTALTAEA